MIDMITHGIIRAVFGGVIGAVVMWLLFQIFCRYYLKTLLLDMTLRNPEFAEGVKQVVEKGIDRVVAAFKAKIPLVSMFLGTDRETELKHIAVSELADKAPLIPSGTFDTIATIIHHKASPWVLLAGFIVGTVTALLVASHALPV